MATEKNHSQDFDLDKTDKLPILVGAMLDAEIGDDAVPLTPESARVNRALRLDYSNDYDEDATLTPVPPLETAGGPNVVPPAVAASNVHDFLRPSPVDLPSLAESMRTVEERIARQQTDYDALIRSFERARESESAALARVSVLERDAALLRSALETEQARVKEYERTLVERQSAADNARARTEQALLEAQRHLSEAKTLKDALASRDATIVEVLHSLGERDAQLTALQQEHDKTRESLDAQQKSAAKLREDLSTANVKSADVSKQLAAAAESSALHGGRVKTAEAEVNLLRAELGSARAVATSYLEQLRTREFRRGFDENLFRELDARVGAAGASLAATLARQAEALKLAESARADFKEKYAVAEAERMRLSAALAERSTALAEARAAASGDVQRITQRLEAAEQRQADQAELIGQLQTEHAAKMLQLHHDHSAKLVQMQGEQLKQLTQLRTDYTQHTAELQSDHAAQLAALQTQHKASVAELTAQAEEREQEMTVLMAHLHEARKPTEPLEAEVRRLSHELGARTKEFEDLNAEARQLRSSLERTRGALEEREFLIRRLERAESNNANVLGRIQTSMERLGSGVLAGEAPITATSSEWSAELIRIDGDRNVSHTLSRRTRIGRASGCELQVDSTSVSRHHALVVAGPRETVIEDLNSTNGVIVNGRKISRAFLNDGDMVIVGDVHFRFAAKLAEQPPAILEAPAAGP